MGLTPKKVLALAQEYTDSVALGQGAVPVPGPKGPAGKDGVVDLSAFISFEQEAPDPEKTMIWMPSVS